MYYALTELRPLEGFKFGVGCEYAFDCLDILLLLESCKHFEILLCFYEQSELEKEPLSARYLYIEV